MSGSVNKVFLIGRLAKDPESRLMSNGGKVVNMTVVTSERWKDKSGERQEKAEFHRVVVFNEHIAGVAESYLKKGAQIAIEGSLQTRKWTDQSGQDKYSTEVVLQKYRGELVMLDSKGESQQGYSNEGQQGGGGDTQGGGYTQDLDDEIPFLTFGDWSKPNMF